MMGISPSPSFFYMALLGLGPEHNRQKVLPITFGAGHFALFCPEFRKNARVAPITRGIRGPPLQNFTPITFGVGQNSLRFTFRAE